MSENKKRRGLFGRPQQSAGQRAEEPRQEQQHTPRPKKKGRAGKIIGTIVLVMVLTGADASGQMMLALHPLITSVACVVKGTLCGAASAAMYQLLARRSGKAAVVAAAAVCPLVNTGVLYLVLVLFFDTSWAAVLSAFMSVNFLLELAVNIVLAPAVLRIVTMRRRTA